MIILYMKLLDQLAVHRLNDLTARVDRPSHRRGHLLLLIAAGQRGQAESAAAA